MVINYHKNFIKDSRKLTIKQKERLAQRLKLFGQDQFHPTLNNHSLRGKYLGCRSINIAGDLRAVFKKDDKDDKVIIFVTINSHSNLYG